jgi:MoxR-like ATPase
MHLTAKTLRQIEDELNSYYLERTDLIRACMLALLSGQHLFVIGGPGTGKSATIDSVMEAIINARKFAIGLSKTRPTEAVLGPLDVLEFRQNGNYFLKRAGYATAVELAKFDEVGKMAATLGHDLLHLFNEREYHEVNGGRSTHKAPLSTAFTTSNEMITDESDDAAALWDRLPIRVMVDYLQSSKNFAKLLASDEKFQVQTTIEWEVLKDAIDNEVPAIVLSDEALRGMVKLRTDLKRTHHIEPGDRRFKIAVRILKANAFLDGRSEVSKVDLGVLRFILWDTVEQLDKVHEICLEASNPFVKGLNEIKSQMLEIQAGVKDRETGDDGQKWQYGKEASDKLGKVRDRLDTMLMEAQGQPIPGFKIVADLHEEVMIQTFMICLDQSREVAQVAASKKLGSGDGGNR